jgi:hypothetical protein
MVVQADLWMERHLCENSTEYAHLYAIRDKLMGSMVIGCPQVGPSGKSLLGSRVHESTLWHLDSSVQWCTRLWMHARIWQVFVVLFAPSLAATFLGVAASLPMLMFANEGQQRFAFVDVGTRPHLKHGCLP